MLVLAIDTATPAVTAGVVDARPDALTVLAERVTVDARAHGELLTPQVLAAAGEATVTLDQLDAIVCGVGPGPYTGLRAGMVTAAALSHALGIPAYPVCSLDAIAASVERGGPFLVITDARRREVYWAAYDQAANRTDGPHVNRPADIESSLTERVEHAYPSPLGLVRAAGEDLFLGTRPASLTPLYLRRPDAAQPGAPKRVTVP